MSNGVTASPNAQATGASNSTTWSKLPSFKPPRDLTLGGRGQKKVFTPNLVVKRNKNLNVKTSKDTTLKRGGGTGRGGGRGGSSSRGGAANNARGGKTSTLIQTKGVFSEGAGDFNIRKAASSGRYGGGGGEGGGGGSDSTTALLRPVLNKENFKKIDMKADEKKLFEITGDSDDEDCFDNYKTDAGDEDVPIRLNEAERRLKIMKLKACKQEILNVKSDPDGSNNNNDDLDLDDDIVKAITAAQKLKDQEMLDAQIELEVHKALPRYPKNINGLLDITEPPLFLLQLPDTLPCENDTSSKEFYSKKETKPTPMELETPSTSTRLNCKPDYNWRTMQEGQIGKLIRYKSGKTKLQLGTSFFDLNVAIEPGFIQDCISIRTKSEYHQHEPDAGGVINLGPISAKITATPHWEECMLFSDADDESEVEKV